MKHVYLLLGLVIIVVLSSCKKEAVAPAAGVTLIGKWQLIKQTSTLFNSSGQIGAYNNAAFTANDFVVYYKDGTGYFSINTPTSPELKEFNYTLKGTLLTQYNGSDNTGIAETVVKLTADSLYIHSEYQVPDPNNETVADTEKDDIAYKKGN